jgi:hypothetical protein
VFEGLLEKVVSCPLDSLTEQGREFDDVFQPASNEELLKRFDAEDRTGQREIAYELVALHYPRLSDLVDFANEWTGEDFSISSLFKTPLPWTEVVSKLQQRGLLRQVAEALLLKKND